MTPWYINILKWKFTTQTQVLVERNYIPHTSFYFLFTFSVKFLYFFISSSLFPYFNLFMSIFIQLYININLHVSTLHIISTFIVGSDTRTFDTEAYRVYHRLRSCSSTRYPQNRFIYLLFILFLFPNVNISHSVWYLLTFDKFVTDRMINIVFFVWVHTTFWHIMSTSSNWHRWRRFLFKNIFPWM